MAAIECVIDILSISIVRWNRIRIHYAHVLGRIHIIQCIWRLQRYWCGHIYLLHAVVLVIIDVEVGDSVCNIIGHIDWTQWAYIHLAW